MRNTSTWEVRIVRERQPQGWRSAIYGNRTLLILLLDQNEIEIIVFTQNVIEHGMLSWVAIL